MSAPLRPRSPLWSVLLRVGIGIGVFGLFVLLFSYDGGVLGFGLFGIGVAFVLAAFVIQVRDRSSR